MKIYIKSADGHGIKLWFPTSLLKSKFVLNYIIKLNSNKKDINIDIEPLMKSLPIIYKNLKNKDIDDIKRIIARSRIISSGDNQVLIKI